jgi:putative transposase
MALSG